MNLTPKPPLRFPIGTLRADGSVDICHNLRPDPGSRSLVAVGEPHCLASDLPPGSRLLPGGAVDLDSHGLSLFFTDSEGLLCRDSDATVYRPDGSASVSPRCVLRSGSELIVMTDGSAAPLRLSRDSADGRWKARSADALPPPLTIVRRDEGLISATIDGRSLRGSYDSRSEGLTAADLATMTEAMTAAYLTVGDRAVSRHVFFQPVIARYRLRAADGTVIYTSAPVMLSPDSGVQLTDVSFGLSGSAFNVVGPATLSARVFSPGLSGRLDAAWASLVASAELQVSPQLHPLEESLQSGHSFGHFTATAGTLSLRLPGLHSAVPSPGAPQTLLHSQVGAILARLDSGALETVGSARFDAATGEWTGLDTPWYADRRDCRADLRALRAVTGLPVSRPTPETTALCSLSAPHVLNASAVAVSGDSVALAGLSSLPFAGSLPAEMAVELRAESEGAEPSAVKVVFADGSSVARTHVGRGVGRLSPLLTYPSPDAVEMRISCGELTLKVALRPDPSGTMAYWLSPSAGPVELTERVAAFVVPSSSPRPRRFPGMIAVSPLASPLSPGAVVRNIGADPAAIVPAAGAAGGWDAGSSRFIVFGRSGIQSLTLNAARSRLTVRSLDPRPVTDPAAVCTAGGAIAAIAGGDLVSVVAQRVTTAVPSAGISRLGYVGARDELWGFGDDEDEAARIFSPDGRMCFTRSSPWPLSLLSSPPGLWATDSRGRLYDLTDERPAETEVAYRASVGVDDPRQALRFFELPLRGAVAGGRAEISGDNGGGPDFSDRLTEIAFKGLLTHLPPVGVYTPHRHRFSLSLNLTVGPGPFRLGS